MDLLLIGKAIYLNEFNVDILVYVTEEYHIGSKESKGGKSELEYKLTTSFTTSLYKYLYGDTIGNYWLLC